MRVLICGSRSWVDHAAISDVVYALSRNDIVITGGAAGADALAERIARDAGIHVAVVRALWGAYGRSAGPRRNLAMLQLQPERVYAFWDGRSLGTGSMIEMARENGIPTEVIVRERVA